MNSSSLSLSFPYSFSKRKRDSDSFGEPCCYKRAKYDVFMNYSSKDIGDSFISHLRGALEHNDFTIPDLHAGQNVCSELLKPIEDSDIYLVVFSSKYPSSVRCLDELVDIMDCFLKFERRRVFPVFFKVEPSDVRNQKGVFKEAFEAHETNFSAERVGKWRQAMRVVGQLSGHHLQYGDKGKFIRQIVKLLTKMKNPLELLDVIHPVGIESRAQEIISKLRLRDNAFTIVAVLGIGGSGKTTIVKAVYDKIAVDFDVRCFIENIHDYKHSGRNWKVDLQREVISRLTGNDKFHNDVPAKIRRFITTQKALLVLDNVDDFEQLQVLGIHHADSFGCGSRIIVTTSDKQSLSVLPYTPYEISLLNNMESFELFIGHAYGKDEHVDKNFVAQIVWRAKGLPLVLEVWGRHFKCHKRNQWPSVLETLKRIPHGDVQKKLQISYDSLTDRAKKLFLDIVFFFYGMEKDLVVEILQDEDYGFFPDIEIQYLVDKGLVKIDGINRMSMHHAIREMGQEVVRRENEDEPGQRTRLMDDRDVFRVLRDCLGTESVESIRLDYKSALKEPVTVQIEAFKKISNLRFIKLDRYLLQWLSSSNGDMSASVTINMKKLKYLEWYQFPFKCIDYIKMDNVVVIKLINSKLEILWEGFKSLPNLRILDVRYAISLTKTGNFNGLKKLERLYLTGCSKLEELDNSIGCLEKLVNLELADCTELKMFPWKMIGKLTSLVDLSLKQCSNICNLSQVLSEIGKLVSLQSLDLSECPFSTLPESFTNLSKLVEFKMNGCSQLESIPTLPPNIADFEVNDCRSLVKLPSNMYELQFLEFISMQNCNLRQVSNEIGNLMSLQILDLSDNPFSRLPDSFSNLSELDVLKMNGCSRLELLPLLPPNLKVIEASKCWSLDVMPYDSMQKSYIFRSKMLEKSFFNKHEGLWISLSGEEVPEWCNYRSDEHVLSFVTPKIHMDNKICGVIICATLNTNYMLEPYLSSTMLNKTKETLQHLYYHFGGVEFIEGSLLMTFHPLNEKTLVVEAGDVLQLEFNFEVVSSCGLSLIYEVDVNFTFVTLLLSSLCHTLLVIRTVLPAAIVEPGSARIFYKSGLYGTVGSMY